MGHNYNKFYHQPKKSENSENKMEEVFEEVISEIITEPEVKVNTESLIEEAEVLTNEEVETLKEEDVMKVEVNEEDSTTTGIVTNCSRLNVRKEADKDSDVLCTIDKDAKVVITLEESTEEFYKVHTSSGVEGFCMKNFITIK